MFKRLKYKFILTNLLLTTVVLLAAYTSVYLIAASNSANRRPIPSDAPAYTSEVENIIDEHIKSDRKKALNSLLFTLIATGVATELVVFIISAYLAEEAIKPVKEAYEAQKLFIANASHEIKTPLAAISATLEAADISGNPWLDHVSLEVNKTLRPQRKAPYSRQNRHLYRKNRPLRLKPKRFPFQRTKILRPSLEKRKNRL